MAEYMLLLNHLTQDPDDCIARVRSQGVADETVLVDDMLKRGTTLNRPELEGTLHMLYDVVLARLGEGYVVRTSLGEMSLTIRGVFEDDEDVFDSARHTLDVSIATPGQMREDVQRQVSLEKSITVKKHPQPGRLEDIATGETNGLITPGGMGGLRGAFLKFDPADPQQGIFFIDAAGNETRVSMLGVNKPSQQMFLVPPTLASGAYTLEVRAVMGTAGLRSGRLPHTLTVP